MVIKFIAIFFLSIISGILYHLGGIGKPFNTKWRDIGCMLCVMATLALTAKNLVYNTPNIAGLLCMAGLTFATFTTYFKPKGKDAEWWNWLLVGLAFGLAALPFVYATQHYFGFILRTMFLGFSICVWSESIGDVFWEEFGRGLLITITVPLLIL